MSARYAWLDDPAERAFLTEVAPAEVLANAHRAYDWLADNGMAPDSVLREAAFTKASDDLGFDYDLLYDAWLTEQPVSAHVLTRAVPVQASGPGALSGHEARCTCGFVARTSLSASEADRQAHDHLAWAARTGR